VRINAALSPVTAQDRTDLQAALDALVAGGNLAPDFAAVRGALASGKRARFVDGLIHQTALDMGLRVEP